MSYPYCVSSKMDPEGGRRRDGWRVIRLITEGKVDGDGPEWPKRSFQARDRVALVSAGRRRLSYVMSVVVPPWSEYCSTVAWKAVDIVRQGPRSNGPFSAVVVARYRAKCPA